jgi:hypothetical protein
MSKRLLRTLLIALSIALLVVPALAKPSKQDLALAKKAAQEGKKHEKKGDWEEAREAWQKAVDLNDTPDARTHLARAEAKLGRLLLAEEILEKALETKKISWAAKHKANKQLKELDKQIPQLRLEPPADFTGKIWVNDEETEASALAEPLRLDPGEHKVRAEAEGYKPFSESIVLEEGDRKDLAILMTELPKVVAPPPPAKDEETEKAGGGTQRTLGWVSLAIGGVGLGVGTVFGLQARSTRDDLDGACSNDVCSESDRELYDEGKSQANIATAGFIVGGVGIGLGTFLLLTAGSDDDAEPQADEARIEPVIGPAHLGVRGVF